MKFVLCGFLLIAATTSVFTAWDNHAAREDTLRNAVLTGQTTAADGVKWYTDHFPDGVVYGEITDEQGKQRPIYDIPQKITVEQWPEVRPQLLDIYNKTFAKE